MKPFEVAELGRLVVVVVALEMQVEQLLTVVAPVERAEGQRQLAALWVQLHLKLVVLEALKLGLLESQERKVDNSAYWQLGLEYAEVLLVC